MTIKIVFVFFLLVLHNDDSIKLDASIVTACPNQQQFTDAMNQKIASKEIQHWEASCFNVRMLQRKKGLES
jgi:hypothetical protein